MTGWTADPALTVVIVAVQDRARCRHHRQDQARCRHHRPRRGRPQRLLFGHSVVHPQQQARCGFVFGLECS